MLRTSQGDETSPGDDPPNIENGVSVKSAWHKTRFYKEEHRWAWEMIQEIWSSRESLLYL